jgi:hypothetical protein
MGTLSRALATKIVGIVSRVVAALQAQRSIDARRIHRQYRHLIEAQGDAPGSTRVGLVCTAEDDSGNADGTVVTEPSSNRTTLERA